MFHVIGPLGGLLGRSPAGGPAPQAPPRLFAGARADAYLVAPIGRRQNQADKNSCVAHAFNKPMENESLARGIVAQICRADIYSGALVFDGNSGKDVGVTLGAMARMIARGVLSEFVRPYGTDDVTQPTSALLDAERVKGVTAVPLLLTVEAIQDALAISGGVPYGQEVRTNYAPDANGVLPLPAGSLGGYHATYLCGWNNTREAFVMENSWKSWGIDHPGVLLDPRYAHLKGKRGFCWVPYKWVTSGAMFDPYYMRGALEVV